MRRFVLASALALGCVSESATVPPAPRARPAPVAPMRVIPDGWHVVTFEHFSFVVPDEWVRFPPKDGRPPLYSDAEGNNGVYGTTLESSEDREEIARKLVNENGYFWTDTVEGAPATYVTGTARADNSTGLNISAVVFQDGALRHYLVCAHFGRQSMSGVCRRVFGSIRFRR